MYVNVVMIYMIGKKTELMYMYFSGCFEPDGIGSSFFKFRKFFSLAAFKLL